ncbi:DUF1654 domain-containing protein [Vreelandella aquamarina]|uniref:DUF1654 domain-containing protein n=1 Tax=Vreelandella aquamarina TaxID=77097 RepID=A0A857GGW2_9GAMM|nr:DUF1654 domain-containing protein [Halomonas meridiana]QHD48499.1 hypothetical protein CTT34_01685 [Halomonas meridiana]
MGIQSYEKLVLRVKRKIGSPDAQSRHCVEIQRQAEDAAEDWAQLLADLGTVENVTMIPLDDKGESVRLRWNPEEAM